MKFKRIIAAGCSFVPGSNILNAEGINVGHKYRVSKLLADRFNAEEINVAIPGSGNSYILNTLIDTLYNHSDLSNTLVIIGLSGISRQEVYVNNLEQVRNLHLFDILKNKSSLSRRADMVTGNVEEEENFYNYVNFHSKYFFNLDYEQFKLRNKLLMLDSFLKERNISYLIFNSIEDNIIDIKDKINYFSFIKNSDEEFEVSERIPRSDYYGRLKDNGLEVEDTWQHFLMVKHFKDHDNSFLGENRNSKPPYGPYFCGGHPSPNGNKLLADLLENYLNSKYSKLI